MRFVGTPSHNKVFTFQACSRAMFATPPYRATNAAKGKGSAGPVRQRRKTETLHDIGCKSRVIRGAISIVSRWSDYLFTVVWYCKVKIYFV